MRDRVDGALRNVVQSVKWESDDQWSWQSTGAVKVPVRGIVSNGWLSILAPLAGGHVHGIAVARCAQDLLICNGRLESAAKLGLRSGGEAVELLAEIRLGEGVDLAQRLAEIDRDFELANLMLARSEPALPASMPGAKAVDVENLKALFKAAGMSLRCEIDSPLTIPLKIEDQVLHAGIELRRPITFTLPLGRWDNLSASAKQAIGALLLEVSGHIRMGRASLRASGTDGSTMAILEARLQLDTESGQPAVSQDSVAELHHALEALTDGARLCVRGFGELSNDEEAVRFLARRGPVWREA